MGNRWEKGKYWNYRWLIEIDRVAFIMVDFRVDLSSFNKCFCDLNWVPLYCRHTERKISFARHTNIREMKPWNKYTKVHVCDSISNEHFPESDWIGLNQFFAFRTRTRELKLFKMQITICLCAWGRWVKLETSRLLSVDDVEVEISINEVEVSLKRIEIIEFN